MMEPYRPFVDDIVFRMVRENGKGLTDTTTKSKLINVMYRDVYMDGHKHPLQVALTLTAASLLRVFKGENKHVALPTYTP